MYAQFINKSIFFWLPVLQTQFIIWESLGPASA